MVGKLSVSLGPTSEANDAVDIEDAVDVEDEAARVGEDGIGGEDGTGIVAASEMLDPDGEACPAYYPAPP